MSKARPAPSASAPKEGAPPPAAPDEGAPAIPADAETGADAVEVLLATLGVAAADALAVNVEAGIVVTRDGKKHRLGA